MDYKKEFVKFMCDSGVLTFGEFTLKSGRKAPYFVNTGNYRTGAQAHRQDHIHKVITAVSRDENARARTGVQADVDLFRGRGLERVGQVVIVETDL